MLDITRSEDQENEASIILRLREAEVILLITVLFVLFVLLVTVLLEKTSPPAPGNK